MQGKTVCIVAAQRTPIGSFGGALKSLSATQLGAIVIKKILEVSGLKPELVDEVFMGNVLQAGLGQAPARQAAIYAGLPNHVIATTINKVCASGMKAIALATQSILLGDAGIVVAGGMESMSNVPYYLPSVRWGNKYGNISAIDGLALDGLTDVYHNYAMGNAAELCSSECKISRAEQDAFAIESYKRSQKAWENHLFDKEVIPIEIPQKNKNAQIINRDEEPFRVQFDKITQLKPSFQKDGTVTAANSSTMNDGAAAVLLMSTDRAAALGLRPIAIIKSYADAAQAPEWFTTAPAIAVPKAIAKAGLNLSDIDYFEINEAFSVVGLANLQKLGLDDKKLNINGGAVSLGHPLGCSGARIIVTLIHVLQQNGGRIGAAGICNGGGGASAMVIELV